MSRRKPTPVKPPSRLMRWILAAVVIGVGFATLMIRLQVTEEGYQLSRLRSEISELQEHDRSLKLEAAQLGSQARLRALAAKFGMAAPARGQVVEVP